MEATLKEAKINQRTATVALTRRVKVVNNLIAGKRSESEVREILIKYQESFEHLVKVPRNM